MIRILCTGDIHIGRRATRIAGRQAERCLSSAAAWENVVAYALGQRVDLVLLSGDLVDRANWFYEAYGPLERGLRALAHASIPVWAVAGNHDFDVLPQLVKSLGVDHFRLLGPEGQWERHTLEREGKAVLHVDGWSFPAEHVRNCPMDSYTLAPDATVPTLGLLHADLDQPRSTYAPVARAQLCAKPMALWILGHVHKPAAIRENGRPVLLYPGSPQAMDPGETGPHGPWMIEIDPGVSCHCRQVPLSAVRYDELELDLSDIDDLPTLNEQVTKLVTRHLHQIAREDEALRFLSCRLILSGRTHLHRQAKLALEQGLLESNFELTDPDNRLTVQVEKVISRMRPALDLDALARGADLAGALARVVRALQQEASANMEGCDSLLQAAKAQIDKIHHAKPYLDIYDPEDEPTLQNAREALLRQSYLLLDELLAQKEQP